MHKPRCHEAFTLKSSLNAQYCQGWFFDCRCPSVEAQVGHLKTTEEFTCCSSSAWRNFAGGKRAVQRDADVVWKPSSQLHCVMNLKQGDTSPAKSNLYCWEPALKKTTPFLSARYSLSRNADVTVAETWSGCCRKNKEITPVRNHPLVLVSLWGNTNAPSGTHHGMMFWSTSLRLQAFCSAAMEGYPTEHSCF